MVRPDSGVVVPSATAGGAPQQNQLPGLPAPLTRAQWLLIGVIFLIGLGLRGWGLASQPPPYCDEYHYAWVGLSLWHGGRAIAWSNLHGFQEHGAFLGTVEWRGGHYNMVRSAVDHPPLFSLVVGAYAWLSGNARQITMPTLEGGHIPFWEVDLGRTRLLALLLYTITFFLLFALARETLPFPSAALAMLLFGCISHLVIYQRMLLIENLVTPLLTLNVLALARYLNGRSSERAFGWITVLTTAAAMLCKLIAVSQAGAVAGLLLLNNRRREIRYPVLGVALGLALLAAYATTQGWAVFCAIQHSQASRFAGFSGFESIVLMPAGHLDPLLSAGWFAALGGLLARRGPRLLYGVPVLYLLCFLFFSAPAISNWHILPFCPFLCLSLAALIGDVCLSCDGEAFTALVALLVPFAFQVIFLEHHINTTILRFSYLGLILTTFLALHWGGPATRRRTVTYVMVMSLTLALAREFWLVRFFGS